MFRVLLVDHVNAAFSTHNLVVGAAFFDTGTHFHVARGLLVARLGADPFLVVADVLRIVFRLVHDTIVKLYRSTILQHGPTCNGRRSGPLTGRMVTVQLSHDLRAGS